jgi:hypothetical protein
MPLKTEDGGSAGNAILLNGVLQIANREIGVPGIRRFGSWRECAALFQRLR